MPIEGRLEATESQAHAVCDLVHPQEQLEDSHPIWARTAEWAASPRKALALPAESCRAVACVACASATAPATRPSTVASCTHRRARACSRPFPYRRGIVLRAVQCAAFGGGQGASTCDMCATDVGTLRCTYIQRRAASAGPAWPCKGVCTLSMCRCSASSSVCRRGPAGGSGQGQAATWEHCVHLFVLVGMAEDTVLHFPQRWQVCGRWEAGDQG